MHISRRIIDEAHPPYIIAEIGVNHDGEVDRANQLVEAAAKAGADAIKMQYFEASRLLSRDARLAEYQGRAGAHDPVELLQALQLNEREMGEVVENAHEQGIHAIVSLFSIETVEALSTLEWDAYKTASPDLVNRPLLQAIESLNRPMILSTGAADMGEVLRSTEWLGDSLDRIALLQCVSAYPTPDECASLAGIRAIQRATAVPVGYSDHTTGTITGALAVAAGAAILEKHLTYDRSARGPDHAASLDPTMFAEYVDLAHRAHTMLGSHEKVVRVVEHDVRDVSRQSIVAVREIYRGEVITRDMLTIKRPGGGIEPHRLESVVGSVAARDIPADRILRERDVLPAAVGAPSS